MKPGSHIPPTQRRSRRWQLAAVGDLFFGSPAHLDGSYVLKHEFEPELFQLFYLQILIEVLFIRR